MPPRTTPRTTSPLAGTGTGTTRPLVRLMVAVAVVALLVAACGGDDDAVETAEPSPTAAPDDAASDNGDADDSGDTSEADDDVVTTDDGDATPTETPEPTPIPDPTPTPPEEDTGPATVLAAVFTGGGFTPVDVALATFPQLVIYTDGSVYRPTADLGFPVPLTAALERLQLSQEQVERLRGLLLASPALTPGVDFGTPNISDAPTTSLQSFAADPSGVTAAVYALGLEEDVAGEAAGARSDFASLIRDITAVVDEAAGTGEPTLPPAAAVLTFPGLGVQENAPVRDWPIASVPVEGQGGTACVVVDGDELATLWEAATGATTQTPWRIDGDVKAVAIRPAYDHEDVC